MEKLSQSAEYKLFRSNIPLKNICVDNCRNKSWKVFDAGPKNVRSPLIFLPPACGTADIYFRQLLELSTCGYRVIAVESPSSYWSVNEWCNGFKLLLDHLCLDKVHLFGASLGGFLAQKFVEHTSSYPRVESLFLCNTFVDTGIFDFSETCTFFWMFPFILLRRFVMPSLITPSHDKDIKHAAEFVIEKLNTLNQADLASRLTINCSPSRVKPTSMRGLMAVTIMDVFDEYAICSPVREEIYRLYPHAKLAQLKSGGNFPYLSRFDEVNLHIKIHLRKFENGDQSAKLKETPTSPNEP
ncbi:maspardin-like [Planococcus citri]|uniref:maspardin-like n=1 Tax=Planococcus citri TaxID=170843 RepID=UPI0031F92210